MHLLSTLVISLWCLWVSLTIILGAEESQLTPKKCAYYRLTMYMDCNNLNLGEIRPNTYPVNESRIKDLLLHHNGLRRLEYNVFYNIPNLLSLDLSDNFLSSLDFRLFVRAPELRTLNIRNNRLSVLGDGRLFEFQKKLSSLVLDFNRIKYVNESVLNPLVSLETLFLFGNSLVCDCELKKTMLWCESRKIETSAVCESPLKYSNSSWTLLNKEDCNKTENVTVPKMEILDGRCNYDSIMKSLDCTDVPLRSISANSFPSNLSLDSLVLRNTSISVLESDVFFSLSSLKLLDLSNNFLENLDHQQFSKLNELVTLNLSYNKFLLIPEYIFKTQKQLKVLKLNNNHLTHLSEETLKPLESLEHLDLSENRFICDCELSEAMLWSEIMKLSTGATCAFPRALTGSSWTILQNNTDCIQTSTEIYTTLLPIPYHHKHFNTLLLICVICTAILFLLSIMGALWYICKYRRKDDSMIYDDICLEERNNSNCYEVLEEKREDSFDNGTMKKPKMSSSSDECGATHTAIENPYEDIESLRLKNKQCSTSREIPKNMLDSTDNNTENKDRRDVPSYMDMSGAVSRPRQENLYVLK